MKLKDQEVGLMILTLRESINRLDELPDTVKIIYHKMINLLFNHFQYSIKDLESVEDFTEEEKFFIEFPVLGVFLDLDSLQDGDPLKGSILKARAIAIEQELQEIKNNNDKIN